MESIHSVRGDADGARALDQNQRRPGRTVGAGIAKMAQFLGSGGSLMLTAQDSLGRGQV